MRELRYYHKPIQTFVAVLGLFITCCSNEIRQILPVKNESLIVVTLVCFAQFGLRRTVECNCSKGEKQK